MNRRSGWLLVLASLLFLPAAAQAHKVSTAYLTLTGDAAQPALFHGRWDISLLDLNFVLGLDSDGNGTVTWGELRAKHAAIARYALAHLAIRADGRVCTLRPRGQQVDSHSDGSYSVLNFDATCPQPNAHRLAVDYRLFYHIDPSHRGIITLRDGAETASAVSAPSDPSINSTSIHIDLPHRAAASEESAFLAANWRWLAPAIGLGFLAVILAGAAIGNRFRSRSR